MVTSNIRQENGENTLGFCPFVYDRALQPEEFLNRGRALRWLSGRIVSGQSTALIGQPHIGKTSMLSDDFDQAAFWKRALSPLWSQFSAGPLYEHYKTAEEKGFKNTF